MEIEINKSLFAAYAGLTASGYDMADKGDPELQGLVSRIREARYPDGLLEYFASARTDQFDVNPYWPRGSVISAACFFITDNGFWLVPEVYDNARLDKPTIKTLGSFIGKTLDLHAASQA